MYEYKYILFVNLKYFHRKRCLMAEVLLILQKKGESVLINYICFLFKVVPQVFRRLTAS